MLFGLFRSRRRSRTFFLRAEIEVLAVVLAVRLDDGLRRLEVAVVELIVEADTLHGRG